MKDRIFSFKVHIFKTKKRIDITNDEIKLILESVPDKFRIVSEKIHLIMLLEK